MPYLGLLDIAGIQSYLYRTYELSKIAKASETIEELSLSGGLFEAQLREASNMFGDKNAALLMAAGGNAALLAAKPETIREAVRRISLYLLEQGTGLEIVVTSPRPYETGGLASVYLDALQQLELRKLTQPRGLEFRFSGLADSKPWPDLPASHHPPRVRESRRDSGLEEPMEFRKLICASAESSDLLAVVSVDGIGMGRRLQQWMSSARDEHNDMKFAREYRAWSDYVKSRWSAAWIATIDAVERAFAREGVSTEWQLKHRRLPSRTLMLQEERYYPFRRIYQGGDDLTFVCDARIVLSMCAVLARELETPSAEVDLTDVPEMFHNLTVSIGAVFVDSHFPFGRAVRMAEEVRMNGKKAAMMHRVAAPPSVIDWWLNRQGALDRPDAPFPGASYKPYLFHVDADRQDLLTWEQLETMLLGDACTRGMWQVFCRSRGKLKDLLAAAESGARAAGVSRLLQLRPLPSPEGHGLPFLPPAADPETGFDGNRTALLDAGELYDIHFPFREAPYPG